MTDKEFTDELFKVMYGLGCDRAEIVDGLVYFYEKGKIFLRDDTPRIPVLCTCFEDKTQRIDIAEYLGIVDWSAVAVDTPVWVKANNKESWRRRYFAYFKDGKVYAWTGGTTSWSCDGENDTSSWDYVKLADEHKDGYVIRKW